MKRRPARKPVRKTASRLRPIPHTPSMDHNPAVTAAFKRKGFHIQNTGGDMMVYAMSDPSIGEINVIQGRDPGDGGIPLSLREPVDVFFLGNEHSEHLLELHFPSVTAFLSRVRTHR